MWLGSGGVYGDDNDDDDEKDEDDNHNDDMIITMIMMIMIMTSMMIMMQVGACFSLQVPLFHRCDRKSPGCFSWSGA